MSTDLIEPARPAYRQPSWLRRHSPPYWLSLVGGGWMLLFFLIPLASGLIVSLETGNPVSGYTLTWNWHIYSQLFVHSDIPYTTFFIRSLYYGIATTILSILIAYPMAYFIAFRVSVRWKSPLILLVLLSFFVSFVIRTDMWSFVLAQQGFVITTLHKLHLVSSNFHILGTSNAVIGGDIYNNLPFMVLPIYVALERIDRRILEAARDLYSNGRQVFVRVVLPLSQVHHLMNNHVFEAFPWFFSQLRVQADRPTRGVATSPFSLHPLDEETPHLNLHQRLPLGEQSWHFVL